MKKKEGPLGNGRPFSLTSKHDSSTTHDSNGNLTTEPQSGKSYSYDAENKLTSSSGGTGTSLSYDPAGRLDTYNPGSTRRFIHDGGEVAAELDSSGNILSRYVRGDGADEPILWWDYAGGALKMLHADERGSIIAVSDGLSSTPAINAYDEYGKPAASNIGRMQYTGQMWLPEANLYYYKARNYAAQLGRFVQTDPIGTSGGVNLYAYTGNDPVNASDPLGLVQFIGDCHRQTGWTLVEGGQWVQTGSWNVCENLYALLTEPERLPYPNCRPIRRGCADTDVPSQPQNPRPTKPSQPKPTPKAPRPENPKRSGCYNGEPDSEVVGSVVGSAAFYTVEGPSLVGAGYAILKGARVVAAFSEFLGPYGLYGGLVIGGLIGGGAYIYDKETNGSLSRNMHGCGPG